MGLPTALLLARSGFQVYGYDIDKKKIQSLKKGNIPFEEIGLKKLFSEVTTFFPVGKLKKSDVFIITVPTPLTNENSCNLGFVISAVEHILPVLENDNLVVLESTVPPGTTEKRVKPILDTSRKEFFLSFVSEKAIPGNTLFEMQNNHRIIGGINPVSAEKTKKIYSSFVKNKIHLTDCTTAETVKLMENTYRDVNIALANEFTQIARNNHINVWEAIDLANLHPRVNIHKPGPGVGGHCIPIDPWFLIENSNDSKIISTAREINNNAPHVVFHQIKEMISDIKNPTITLFGVSYKGNVDDTRMSPAIKLIELAKNEKIKVNCYDPIVDYFEYELLDLHNSLKNSDCIVILADHTSFKEINPNDLKMRTKNIVDTRNMIFIKDWINAGFNVKEVSNSDMIFY